MDEIKKNKIKESHIICMNFELKEFSYIKNDDDLYKHIKERIEDNYPKYVISTDTIDLSQDGIIHKNIIDFLLEE